jgi:hypothetical protein
MNLRSERKNSTQSTSKTRNARVNVRSGWSREGVGARAGADAEACSSPDATNAAQACHFAGFICARGRGGGGGGEVRRRSRVPSGARSGDVSARVFSRSPDPEKHETGGGRTVASSTATTCLFTSSGATSSRTSTAASISRSSNASFSRSASANALEAKRSATVARWISWSRLPTCPGTVSGTWNPASATAPGDIAASSVARVCFFALPGTPRATRESGSAVAEAANASMPGSRRSTTVGFPAS